MLFEQKKTFKKLQFDTISEPKRYLFGDDVQISGL